MQSLHGILKLSILRAYNLKDTHIFGKNHPYLKILVDGVEQKVVNEAQRYLDPSKADDPVNPEFECEYEIPLDSASKEVHVEVWGRELLIDSKLGSAIISFNELTSQAHEKGPKSIKAYSLFSEKRENEVVGAVEVGAAVDSLSQARPLQASLTSQTKESTTHQLASELGTDDKHAGHVTEEMQPIDVPLRLPIRVGLVLPAEHKELDATKSLVSDPNFKDERVAEVGLKPTSLQHALEQRFQNLGLKDENKQTSPQLAVGEIDVPREEVPLVVQPVFDEAMVHPSSTTSVTKSSQDKPTSDLPGEEQPIVVHPVINNTTAPISSDVEMSSKHQNQEQHKIHDQGPVSSLPAEEQPILVQPVLQSSETPSAHKDDIAKDAFKQDLGDKTASAQHQEVSTPYSLSTNDLSQSKEDVFQKDDDIQQKDDDIQKDEPEEKDDAAVEQKDEINKDEQANVSKPLPPVTKDSNVDQIQTSGDIKEDSSSILNQPQKFDEQDDAQDDDQQGDFEEGEDEGEAFDSAQYEEVVGKKELHDFQAEEQARAKSSEQADISNRREEVGGTAAAAVPGAVSAPVASVSTSEKSKNKRRRRHRSNKKQQTKTDQSDISNQPQQKHVDRALYSDKLK